MDTQNTSGLGDTSWKSVSYNPLRSSQMEDFSKDASYLRLSLGEFFGQRSEALGCLGVDGDVKRVFNWLFKLFLPVNANHLFLIR